MTKPELIAALSGMSETLGRTLSTEGTVPELEARLAEAQAEAALLDDEITDDADAPATPSDSVADTDPAPAAAGDRRRIRVLHAMDVFHYPANGSVARRAIIQPGQVIDVSAADAAGCVLAGYAEDA
ncbi:DNA-packaging protein FI [Pantoea agglomerans]|uniref:DNA-packaging protein FI n=1 Tax=Enterobacter agglomerans TaxID=549 RepID=UPI0013B9DD9C|nr:DNA-packaging protein FI [Pantoea agglomerans]NEG58192.1 hypothetical protein [Pantoea agglomerans]NEG99905.1 hypothetical protein [Pantoea agglomerans]NEH04132.1 hypothetical protein [Pantoea agglomerans]NEH14465.1 hypothetical protein [Pantoea agglomerans]